VCGAGKTSLVLRLRQAGYDAGEIAQEHSYVADMWQRIRPPDVLIYLDAGYDAVIARRPNSLLTLRMHEGMLQRLAHARQHADLVLATDGVSEEELLQQVASYLTLLMP